jgi:hypothetical protein
MRIVCFCGGFGASLSNRRTIITWMSATNFKDAKREHEDF